MRRGMKSAIKLGTALIAAAHLTACGDSGGGSSGSTESGGADRGSVTVIGAKPVAAEKTYGLCAGSMKHTDFLRMMNGNLVFVADANAHGHSASQAITGLIAMIVLNGLDFEELAGYAFDFNDGDYTF